MARIDPLPLEALPHLHEQAELSTAVMGFLPNSIPTMARLPGLAEGFFGLAAAVMGQANLSGDLIQMIAQVSSTASGCRYCQAHTANSAARMGASEEKLADLWAYSTSEHFNEAERAALDLAAAAGAHPNAATDEHFDELRKHYDDEQIVGIVSVISLFGYLNRWNDTMATDLEDHPTEFAERVLAPQGWDAGKHANR